MIRLFVFDTNCLISANLINGSLPSKAYQKALLSGVLICSEETFNEFSSRFVKAKFDRYLSRQARQQRINEYRTLVKFIPVSRHIKASRDADDDKFLSLAFAAKADCIITGDNDLLTLHPFRDISILSPADFISRY